MGEKSKYKKILRALNETLNNSLDQNWPHTIPLPIFRALKISTAQRRLVVLYSQNYPGEDTRALPGIFRLFWIPKKSLVKWPTQKIYLPNFPPPKNPGIEFLNPPKSFDNPRHLKSEVPTPHTGPPNPPGKVRLKSCDDCGNFPSMTFWKRWIRVSSTTQLLAVMSKEGLVHCHWTIQLLRRVDWGISSAESGELKRDLLSPKGHGPRIAAISS